MEPRRAHPEAVVRIGLLGLDDVTIYMALVTLYVAMGAFGGTLRADLGVALLYATGIALFVAVPLFVASFSVLAGSVRSWKFRALTRQSSPRSCQAYASRTSDGGPPGRRVGRRSPSCSSSNDL